MPNTGAGDVDNNYIHKSDILPLQRRLLDVMRVHYTEMGADQQVVDLLCVVGTQLEKGDFTKLDSFDVLLQRGTQDRKPLHPYQQKPVV